MKWEITAERLEDSGLALGGGQGKGSLAYSWTGSINHKPASGFSGLTAVNTALQLVLGQHLLVHFVCCDVSTIF
jgi:hypothetical protein